MSVTLFSMNSEYSIDIQIIVTLYHYTKVLKEKVWFTKLCSLFPYASKSRISRSLDILSDWGMIKSQYGETEKDHASRLYFVSSELEDEVKQWYKQITVSPKESQEKTK